MMPFLFLKSCHPARPAQPTPAQQEAGNYAKKRIVFQGLPITIENPRGSIRSGRDRGGHEWSVSMAHHYGYIRGTVGTDGDHHDVYVGPNAAATHAFIVTTMAPPSFTKVDEQKTMLGFNSENEARAAYLAHYDDPRFFGGIRAMPMAEFKEKVMATTRGGPVLLKGAVLFLQAQGSGGGDRASAPITLRRHAQEAPPAPPGKSILLLPKSGCRYFFVNRTS